MGSNLKSRLLGVFLVGAFAAAGLSGCSANEAMVLPVDADPLVITTAKGEVKLEIEIADTSEKQSRGLMFRPPLPQGRGMLFVMETEEIQQFWMKNTPSPLDLVFAAKDGVVVSIKQGEPLSTASISSVNPAKFVLEIAQGEAARLGIEAGSRMQHRLIQP